jgi:alpha/beta superfamily hydrolase
MVLPSHSNYLKFFLGRGINVFTWNYRGYGRSKGSQSPDCFERDIISVIDYIRKELGVTGKLGVYGRSLGGIATSAISSYCDMVIIDRSFSNLHEMAVWKYHGPAASLLFKIGSCGWQVQSDFNYLK